MLLMIKPASCDTPVCTLAVLLFFTLNYTAVCHHSTEVSLYGDPDMYLKKHIYYLRNLLDRYLSAVTVL